MPHRSILLICILVAACGDPGQAPRAEPDAPALLIGEFEDDYEIRYSITPEAWVQQAYATYHIQLWNPEEQYLIARNDTSNATGGGLWTRFDWIELQDMPPFDWAFCMTVYEAESAEEAESANTANRDEPRTGCNGFPFSRMKTVAR